jgi:pyochelin biosynthesis protein PchC
MAVLEDDEMRRAVLLTLRGGYQAVETYRYRPGARLRCPLSVFTGDSDPRVSREDAQAWQELTIAAFRLREFRGGHFYLSDKWAAVAPAACSELARFSGPGRCQATSPLGDPRKSLGADSAGADL